MILVSSLWVRIIEWEQGESNMKLKIQDQLVDDQLWIPEAQCKDMEGQEGMKDGILLGNEQSEGISKHQIDGLGSWNLNSMWDGPGFVLEITEHKENQEHVVMSCKLDVLWQSAKLRVATPTPSWRDC